MNIMLTVTYSRMSEKCNDLDSSYDVRKSVNFANLMVLSFVLKRSINV
jgi:hypothetical protein